MPHCHLGGMRVAVFADLPHAVGLLHVLHDLGCRPVLIGIRGHTLGGRDAFEAMAKRSDAPLDPEVPIFENPSIHRVRQEMERLITGRQVDAIIGSSTDINAVASLNASIAVQIDHGGAWTGSGPKIIEFGFPCSKHHVVRPSPTLGFSGILGWADRLINAPRLWDTWRTQPT